MGRNRGGYTIVEVMVVVAISVLLFTSALLLVNGQQGETQFTQTIQDISSKMQNYVGQIKAGSFPGSENYNCTVPSGQSRPVLSLGASSGQDLCIILGRAFQVEPGKGTIHSYVILGTRDVYSGASDSGQLASTLDQANPTPAMDSNQNYLLVDSYTLGSNATISSSKVTASGQTSTLAGEYDLVGIYSQPEGSIDNGGGNPVLSMRGYPYNGNSYAYQPNPNQPGQLLQCIAEFDIDALDCSPANVPSLSRWLLCISSGNSHGGLEIDANAGGVTTSLKECS